MNQRSKKMPNAANRQGMLVISLVVLILLGILLAGSRRLTEKNKNYESQKVQLNQEIHDEQIRTDRIDRMKEDVDSSDYIEKIAREKLGLVYEDEVIYKAED